MPPVLFEDSSGSRQGDSWNSQVEERGGAELSEVKHNAKFLKNISATEKTGTTGLCKSLLSC